MTFNPPVILSWLQLKALRPSGNSCAAVAALRRRLHWGIPGGRSGVARSIAPGMTGILFSCLFFAAFTLEIASAFAAEPPTLAVSEAVVCDGSLPGGERGDFDETGCERRRIGDIDPQAKLLWLRATVTFDAEDDLASAPLAVFSGALASREIWWNGEKIGSVGRPGASRADEEAGRLDAAIYIPPTLLRAGDNLLALRTSSFDAPVRVGGPMHFIFVGPQGPFYASILRAYIPAMLTAGALIAAATYFGAAFFRDRRHLGALFIALMATFAVLQLGTESLRGLIDYPYPFQIWRVIGVAMFAFGFSLSMTAYVARRYAPDRWRRWLLAAAIPTLLIAPIMPGFDVKALGALLVPTLVSLMIAARAARAWKPGAPAAAAALFLFATLILAFNVAFLDRGFYFAAGALVVVLLVDQLGALAHARAAAEEAHAHVRRLELELLKRRIAPHFLMNTLNALSEWVESDPKTGVKMIEALAGEFRILSQVSDRAFIPLAEEIALCRRHLEVMSYRVDRAFSLNAEDADDGMEVPPGVIHTLIENAFTHGRFADGAQFALTTERVGDQARLIFLAPAADASRPRNGGGEGLAYVKGRLAAAFGPEASVESGPAEGGGWRTVIALRARRRDPTSSSETPRFLHPFQGEGKFAAGPP